LQDSPAKARVDAYPHDGLIAIGGGTAYRYPRQHSGVNPLARDSVAPQQRECRLRRAGKRACRTRVGAPRRVGASGKQGGRSCPAAPRRRALGRAWRSRRQPAGRSGGPCMALW